SLPRGCPEIVRRVLLPLLLLGQIPGCQRSPSTSPTSASARVGDVAASTTAKPAFVGSKNCRDCHEQFHKLWATSRHGLAMQPYSSEMADKELRGPANDVSVGPRTFRAEIDKKHAIIWEKGPDGVKSYPIAQLMGGKNVYYFLTPLERGRLQVLPIAL